MTRTERFKQSLLLDLNRCGATLLSTCNGSRDKLQVRCPLGHTFTQRADRVLQQGQLMCPTCQHKQVRISPLHRLWVKGFIPQIISMKGAKIIPVICPNGHFYAMAVENAYRRQECGVCNNGYSSVYTTDAVRKAMLCEGYTLLSDLFESQDIPLDYRCPRGHFGQTFWNNWLRGHRCSKCRSEIHKTTPDMINHLFDTAKVSLKMINHYLPETTVDFMCSRCHQDFSTNLRNIRRTGVFCPSCDRYVSKGEQEIQSFVGGLALDYRKNVFSLVPRSEIDIVIDSLKIGIEYCGLYYHTEHFGRRDKNYHLDKLRGMARVGYRLITIFEDEYINKQQIVLNRLKHILKKSWGFKIHARDCEIRDISYSQAKDFLESHHLQGKGPTSIIRIGAFFEDLLIAVMTFSTSNLSRRFFTKEGTYELDRFCSHPDFCIPGIASKLLRYFETHVSWEQVISFADKRWSDGGLYYNLGFTLIKETAPNYWYVPKGYTKRIHRFALRKNQEDTPDLTEWENRQAQGYDRIWDCGNLKFIKERI